MANSNKEIVQKIINEITDVSNSLDPEDALNLQFEIENQLYELQGRTSIRYGNGIHTKHKHINYHKFFQEHIESGESVLDIGSSNGELTADIAKKANPGKVIGIEIEEPKHTFSKEHYKADNLEFILGDATKDLPDQHFDVVTMSNVLEHIEHRVEILKTLKQKYNPKKFIIRVPSFERDWRVPLKKEIGMEYRLDPTHFIEFTNETFLKETQEAGLKIVKQENKWGEIWAVLN